MNVTNSHPEADHDDVYLGLEIEFAARAPGTNPLQAGGVPVEEPTDSRRGKLRHAECGKWTYEWMGGDAHSIEAITPDGGIPHDELPEWYRRAVAEMEHKFGFQMAPTSVSKGCPVGLHTHISPLTENQARQLYDISKEPFMQAFACTSLASRNYNGATDYNFSVLRERGTHYCDFSRDGLSHHCCPVNKHRDGGLGHYEWRLPEPMLPENLDLLVEFLQRFMGDPDSAAEWAREQVYNSDDITSLKRAEAIGDELRNDSETKTPATYVVEDVVFN